MSADSIVNTFVNMINSFIVENLNTMNRTNTNNSSEEELTQDNDNTQTENGTEINGNTINLQNIDSFNWELKIKDPVFEQDELHNEGEKIEAIRYVVESYANPDQKTDLIRWFAYYLPRECLEIKVRSYGDHLSFIGTNPIIITKIDQPRNLFRMDMTDNIYESQLERVYVSKQWINKCIEYYTLSKKLKNLQIDLFINSPTCKTVHDKVLEIFENGMHCFELNSYEKGREHFLKCIELLDNMENIKYKSQNSTYYLCYYNISCCYARERDDRNALDWLQKAFMFGYVNWSHTISDKDMRHLLDNEEFINLIREMKKVNPKRDVESNGVIKAVNIIDLFLKKNHIK